MNDGLTAHYEFEGDETDSSGNGHHGSESGGVNYVSGVIGQAASFDGVDDYIKGNPINLNSDDYSINSWVKLDSSCSDNDVVFSLPAHEEDEDALSFYYQCDTGFIKSYSYTGEYIESDSRDIKSSWNQISVIKKGSIRKLYLNGTEIVADEVPEAMNYENTRSFLIGAEDDYSNDGHGDIHWFKGFIDDLRIYNRALSDSEVQELYKLGAN